MINNFITWLFSKVLGPLADRFSIAKWLERESEKDLQYMILHWDELTPENQLKIANFAHYLAEKNRTKKNAR